jgi:hypothetical protein
MIRVIKGPLPHSCSATYKITFRNQRDMAHVFDIDYEVYAPTHEHITLIIRHDLGKYGGLKAELIGEINEITN